MSQLQRWFKKNEKEFWDAIKLRVSGHTRLTLSHLTILKFIGAVFLEFIFDKDKRGSAKDLSRVKWELALDDVWHCFCYKNDSLWNQLS